MTDRTRINRNNKKRGADFERFVADYLGFTRVPFSGGVRAWGVGDVQDGYFSKDGIWALECKTQKGRSNKTVLIEKKWIKQMLDAATTGRKSAIVFRVVASTKQYVLMDEDTFDWFREQVDPGKHFMCTCWPALRTVGLGHNFAIPYGALFQTHNIKNPLHLAVKDRLDGEQTNWFVYSLDAFKSFIDAANLYVPEKKNV